MICLQFRTCCLSTEQSASSIVDNKGKPKVRWTALISDLFYFIFVQGFIAERLWGK